MGGTDKISFIDVHTGLGKYGQDTLISDPGYDTNSIMKIRKLMPEHVKQDLIVDTRETMGGL